MYYPPRSKFHYSHMSEGSLTFLGQDSGGGEGEAKAAFSRDVEGREPDGGPTTGRFPNGYGFE